MGYGSRPTGVTVLAILAILMVLACLLLIAVFAWVIGFTGNPDFLQALRNSGAPQFVIDNISLILMVYTLLLTAYLVIFGLLAFSFLTGARWGWGLGVGFSIFIIAFGIVMFILTPSLSGTPGLIFQLIIDGLILYYINTPTVIAWFKGPGAKGLWGRGSPVAPPLLHQQQSENWRCAQCGTFNIPDTLYCGNCGARKY